MYLKKSQFRHYLAFILLSSLTLTFNQLAINHAQAEEDHQLARKLRQQGEILSLEKILNLARGHKNGEVLETELEKKRGRYVYEIEMLDAKSQVWELKLDAKTGQLIKMELDD